jgi:hypothetical protein
MFRNESSSDVNRQLFSVFEFKDSPYCNSCCFSHDTFGNVGTSQTVDFTITKLLEPFPVVAVAAVSAVAVVVIAGLLVYHKKHKLYIVQINSGSVSKDPKNYQYL